MSPQYAVLNGRPIDKWRVTELKDELKRRKMMTKGLKDELVKRLDEVLRQDMEDSEEEKAKGVVSDAGSVGKGDLVGDEPQLDGTLDGTIQPSGNNTSVAEETAPATVIAEDKGFIPNDNVVGEEPKLDQSLDGTVQPGEKKTSNMDETTVTSVIAEDVGFVANENMVSSVNEKRLDSNPENVDAKPREIDNAPVVSQYDNQVYEVMPDLGSHVKSESFSSESKFEKNELHDNLNANNVDLELKVFKPEKVQSSTSGGHANGVDSPLLVDQKLFDDKDCVNETVENTHVDNIEGDDTAKGVPLEKLKHVSADNSVGEELQDCKKNDIVSSIKVEVKGSLTEATGSKDITMVTKLSHTITETRAEGKIACFPTAEEPPIHDDKEPTDVDSYPKSDNMTGTTMEKLNLDHYAEDDFMEEDLVDTKQVDSNASPTNAANKIGEFEVPGSKLGFKVDSADSVETKSYSDKNGSVVTAPEKRKLKDDVADEPPKRQRRWNAESVTAPERRTHDLKPCAALKDSQPATKTNSRVGRPDSTVGEDAPKERIVPPSLKPATTSLRIDQFVRPFTLKAVQELLAKTGKVSSFWMDQIKTHCYVMYSSVEEAEATRNSVYNLQWPPNGGRYLVAEFVDPQEVKMRAEPAAAATPSPTLPTVPVQQPPTPSARQQQSIPKLPPPPPVAEIEAPIVTLDDLFKKTIATPRIYYLPLSDLQVAAKLARGNNGRSIRN